MHILCGLILLGGSYPLLEAWRANRKTTLRQTLLWALAAWAAWVWAIWSEGLGPGQRGEVGRYLALSLTACAGVAVLGARRPGVGAWNFVVVGLLAVLLLAVALGFGSLHLEKEQLVFLAVLLAIPLFNYLPTRFAPAVLLFAPVCASEVVRLAGVTVGETLETTNCWLLAVTPWTAWVALRTRRTPATEFDRTWLAFRDRFGAIWGLRAREQFNRAAANAGWPIFLTWHGLQPTEGETVADLAQASVTLQAVLKRFGPEEKAAEAPADLY